MKKRQNFPEQPSVFNYDPTTTVADETKYAAMIEQYKIYMGTLTDSSHARRTFHTVFISINSLLFFAISLATKTNGGAFLPFDTSMLLFINLMGVIMSLAWYFIVYRYRVRSGEALCILSEVENKLPLRLFQTEYERVHHRFESFLGRILLHVELFIPWAFALMHGAIAIGLITGFLNLGIS